MEQNEKRERVLRIIRELLKNTVENGCTPAEAARAAAKAELAKLKLKAKVWRKR